MIGTGKRLLAMLLVSMGLTFLLNAAVRANLSPRPDRLLPSTLRDLPLGILTFDKPVTYVLAAHCEYWIGGKQVGKDEFNKVGRTVNKIVLDEQTNEVIRMEADE